MRGTPTAAAARGRMLAVLACLWGAGCERAPGPTVDGGRDVLAEDGATRPDGAPTALAVDFTAAGCLPAGDGGVASGCRGPAPLTLAFAPLVTGALTEFLWLFGDDTQSRERNPVHTFTLPGRYDVSVIAQGPFGSVARTSPAFVIAEAGAIGQPCEVDVQCTEGLSCVCGSAAGCSAAFARGLCARACRDSDCPVGAVCADLSLSGPLTETTPWRQPLCLSPCERPSDCPLGFSCRDLPGRFPAGRWVRACFADEPAAVGAGCRTATGELSAASCLTGLCLDLGAHGACSYDCDKADCPPGSACATLSGGQERCIPRCQEGSCSQDALLACQPPGQPGPQSFSVPDAGPDDRFCMPRSCSGDADCGLIGRCVREGDAGHCARP